MTLDEQVDLAAFARWHAAGRPVPDRHPRFDDWSVWIGRGWVDAHCKITARGETVLVDGAALLLAARLSAAGTGVADADDPLWFGVGTALPRRAP